MERLGLAGMTLDEVRRYVETGEAIATPGDASMPGVSTLSNPGDVADRGPENQPLSVSRATY